MRRLGTVPHMTMADGRLALLELEHDVPDGGPPEEVALVKGIVHRDHPTKRRTLTQGILVLAHDEDARRLRHLQ